MVVGDDTPSRENSGERIGGGGEEVFGNDYYYPINVPIFLYSQTLVLSISYLFSITVSVARFWSKRSHSIHELRSFYPTMAKT